MNTNSPAVAVSQLCPKCGLCCNGVLFADVELQKGDDAKRLAEIGLLLGKKGGQKAFTQPCGCFDGTFCRIYDDRPKRCRTFECGLLKRVQACGIEAMDAVWKRLPGHNALPKKFANCYDDPARVTNRSH